MPKPIHQRGFRVERKIFDRGRITNLINSEGLEVIFIEKDRHNSIRISSDEGNITDFSISTPQFFKLDFDRKLYESFEDEPKYDSESDLEEETDLEFDFLKNSEMPEENIPLNLEQAAKIYQEVKRILNIEEKLKDYIPQFSHISELNLYSALGIDDASELEKYLGEEEDKKEK